jgi:hypothetical protein
MNALRSFETSVHIYRCTVVRQKTLIFSSTAVRTSTLVCMKTAYKKQKVLVSWLTGFAKIIIIKKVLVYDVCDTVQSCWYLTEIRTVQLPVVCMEMGITVLKNAIYFLCVTVCFSVVQFDTVWPGCGNSLLVSVARWDMIKILYSGRGNACKKVG